MQVYLCQVKAFKCKELGWFCFNSISLQRCANTRLPPCTSAPVGDFVMVGSVMGQIAGTF